jgi:hypothetical protein
VCIRDVAEKWKTAAGILLGFTSIADAASDESGAGTVVLPGIFLTWVNFAAALPAVFPTPARDVRHARLVLEGACRR